MVYFATLTLTPGATSAAGAAAAAGAGVAGAAGAGTWTAGAAGAGAGAVVAAAAAAAAGAAAVAGVDAEGFWLSRALTVALIDARCSTDSAGTFDPFQQPFGADGRGCRGLRTSTSRRQWTCGRASAQLGEPIRRGLLDGLQLSASAL